MASHWLKNTYKNIRRHDRTDFWIPIEDLANLSNRKGAWRPWCYCYCWYRSWKVSDLWYACNHSRGFRVWRHCYCDLPTKVSAERSGKLHLNIMKFWPEYQIFRRDGSTTHTQQPCWATKGICSCNQWGQSWRKHLYSPGERLVLDMLCISRMFVVHHPHLFIAFTAFEILSSWDCCPGGIVWWKAKMRSIDRSGVVWPTCDTGDQTVLRLQNEQKMEPLFNWQLTPPMQG